MSINSHFLVLCQDTATGLARVGWAVDHPPGRFDYLELICEAEDCSPLISGSPCYSQYQLACDKAKSLNEAILIEQTSLNLSRGWLQVPLELATTAKASPDEFGSYQIAAMKAFSRLTSNCTESWAVVANGQVTHIASRQPTKPYQELEYQVWKHSTLSKLASSTGAILEGILVVQESGLWFKPDTELRL